MASAIAAADEIAANHANLCLPAAFLTGTSFAFVREADPAAVKPDMPVRSIME